ncbi:hypothetical protein HWV62_22660 [Athelia sp. TMB]|nr:hypothetical protein HWV62_22660 [Athelia sp. TMB]
MYGTALTILLAASGALAGSAAMHLAGHISSNTSNALASSSSSSLSSCLSSAGLSPITSSSSSYAADVVAYNHRLKFKPVSVVYPTNAAGVASAVKCAASAGVKVAARSGGHSYAANGLGGQDGSLVVDLKHLHSIKVTASSQKATFGTGIRLGDLALALYNNGGQAMAHGTCPYVGTGGHLACGGFGFPSRQWGLALDAVTSAEVVLANGTIVKASSNTNPDLFFAIRGAAPSFGIVTQLTVKTQPAPSSNILFEYTFNPATASAAAKMFAAYQTWGANTAPPQIGIHIELDAGYFALSGVYYGSKSAFTSAITPLLNAMGKPASTSVKTYDWIGILTQLAGSDGPLNTSTKADESDTFYAKSLMVAEDALLTDAALLNFMTYLYGPGVKADSSWFILADLWGGPGSGVNAVSSTATAFSHRNTLYTFQIYTSSGTKSFPSDGISFVDGIVNSITEKMPSTSFGAYNCYVDPALTASQAHTQYYGSTTTTKLNSIKAAVDPKHVFSFPQAIGQS